jgi:CRP-like cAMP-binding protein
MRRGTALSNSFMEPVHQVHIFDFAPGRCMQLDPTAFVAEPELLGALTRRATPIICDCERVLFRQGDEPSGLYILQSGEAVLSMVSLDGEPVLSFEIGAGSLLGLPGLISGHAYTLTAIARPGAQVCFLSQDQFKAFMQSFPLMAFKILQVLAAEVSAARRAITA